MILASRISSQDILWFLSVVSMIFLFFVVIATCLVAFFFLLLHIIKKKEISNIHGSIRLDHFMSTTAILVALGLLIFGCCYRGEIMFNVIGIILGFVVAILAWRSIRRIDSPPLKISRKEKK